jgi:hypothetical protein
MEVRAWDVGKSECRLVMRRIRVSTSPGTKVSPRPTGASLRERMENTLNGESQESWRWFDHPAERPLLWPVQSLVPTMVVSQRLLGCTGQPGSITGSAFEVLEPYAGRSSRQGCDPAGESPAVSVAHVGHEAMPQPRMGNHLGDAWCKRPGRPTARLSRWVQPGGLASVGA